MMNGSPNKLTSYLVIIIIGFFLFIPSLGIVHLFDWDEINFAESAREMLITKDFFRVQVNFLPFWEKPPLFIWLQAFAMYLFGVNEFSARLPNALAGIATLLILFRLGNKYFSTTFGWIWVLVYAGSFLTHLYFKSGIIDPIFNLFIFLGIFHISLATYEKENESRRVKHILFTGLFIGLAVLTKGPVALLIILLCCFSFIILKRDIFFIKIKEWLIFFFIIGIISFAWFGIETVKNGPWFIQEFITYQIRLFKTQDAGHGGPFIYHFIVLYIGCFPASIFIFKGFRKYFSDSAKQVHIKIWMIISFIVVLLLFSIVKTKIVHYSSFCYFPLTFLTAYVIEKAIKGEILLERYFKIQVGIIGLLIGLILFLFPLVLIKKNYLLSKYSHLIKDPFALANLEADVSWSGYETLIGIFYIFSIIYVLVANLTIRRKVVILFVVTSLIITATLNIIVPKIERYSQGAAIDFFKTLQGRDVYVDVIGYKSYAHLFYSRKQPWVDSLSIDKDWLLRGSIDKDVYFVSKIDKPSLDQEPGVVKLGSQNGFVFYLRKALKQNN